MAKSPDPRVSPTWSRALYSVIVFGLGLFFAIKWNVYFDASNSFKIAFSVIWLYVTLTAYWMHSDSWFRLLDRIGGVQK